MIIIQDNRILAELENSRTTGPSLSHVTGMTTTSIIPSNLSYTTGGLAGLNTSIGTSGLSGITSGIIGMGLSSSASSHALAANYDGVISGIGSGGTGGTSTSISAAAAGVNISPLPIRANQISSTMPPICQV